MGLGRGQRYSAPGLPTTGRPQRLPWESDIGGGVGMRSVVLAPARGCTAEQSSTSRAFGRRALLSILPVRVACVTQAARYHWLLVVALAAPAAAGKCDGCDRIHSLDWWIRRLDEYNTGTLNRGPGGQWYQAACLSCGDNVDCRQCCHNRMAQYSGECITSKREPCGVQGCMEGCCSGCAGSISNHG